MTEINLNRNKHVEYQKLFGWGSNINGQLGLFGGAFFNSPTEIPVPINTKEDQIKEIICIPQATFGSFIGVKSTHIKQKTYFMFFFIF